MIIKECLYCKKKFQVKNYRKETAHFCSYRCNIKSRPAWNKGKRNGSILFKCKTCNKEFYRTKSSIKYRKTGKFCSKKCKGKWMSKNLIGEKSYLWKDGKSSENRLIRYSKKMDGWRKKVFERDNYICQNCGARNGNGKDIYLEAHHIKAFSKFPKLRFALSNGKTLCEDCHDNITFNKGKLWDE